MSGNITNPNSIRQIVLRGLMSGRSTKEIAEEIQTAHPSSAAASKSVKHIAWHKANFKKTGVWPVAKAADAE